MPLQSSIRTQETFYFPEIPREERLLNQSVYSVDMLRIAPKFALCALTEFTHCFLSFLVWLHHEFLPSVHMTLYQTGYFFLCVSLFTTEELFFPKSDLIQLENPTFYKSPAVTAQLEFKFLSFSFLINNNNNSKQHWSCISPLPCSCTDTFTACVLDNVLEWLTQNPKQRIAQASQVTLI